MQIIWYILIISQNFNNQYAEGCKTSIIAKLPKDSEAGSLAHFLQQFTDAGINLNKIESRPAKENSTFSYWFLIEFDGHLDQPEVKTILERNAEHIKWLGSYIKLC